MKFVPSRGRVVVVDFELGGKQDPPEMDRTMRPCVVVQNNAMERGRLITVVPLSTTAPHMPGRQHHLMDHRSFREWPLNWGGQGTPRWAKCDYIATISLERCVDPYTRDPYGNRKYRKVKIIAADLLAIEKCILWAMGIAPTLHIQPEVAAASPEAQPPQESSSE